MLHGVEMKNSQTSKLCSCAGDLLGGLMGGFVQKFESHLVYKFRV